MTVSVGGEGKERDKDTTPVEDAKPGWDIDINLFSIQN